MLRHSSFFANFEWSCIDESASRLSVPIDKSQIWTAKSSTRWTLGALKSKKLFRELARTILLEYLLKASILMVGAILGL
jgi:hypothetical protein